MSQLISVAELEPIVSDVVLIDTRFNLKEPGWGKQVYRQGHIPGAVYFDLDEDLSSPVKQHGGRHPLPEPQQFAGALGRAGISLDSRVVVYDQGNSMFAGRAWWLLRYYGVAQVQVLDGGLAAWQAAGHTLSDDVPSPEPVSFNAKPNHAMTVDADAVQARIGQDGTAIVDARASERYRGEVEPIDPKAGHIPSAINKPFAENLNDGHFKPREALQARFEELELADEVIVYCGSGVTAAHNILAMLESGMPAEKVKLYPGSWSDWSSYPERAVATGTEAKTDTQPR